MNNRININAVTEKADSLDRSSNTSVDRVLGDDTLFKHLFEDATLNDLMNIARVSKRWRALATPMVRSLLASYPLRRRELAYDFAADRQTMDRDIYESLIRSAQHLYDTYYFIFDAVREGGESDEYYFSTFTSGERELHQFYDEIITNFSHFPDNLFLLIMRLCFNRIEESDFEDDPRVVLRIPEVLPHERIDLLIDEGIYKVFLTSQFLTTITEERGYEQVCHYCKLLFIDERLSLIPNGFASFDTEGQINYVKLMLNLLIIYFEKQNADVVLKYISPIDEDCVLNQKLADLFKLARFELPDVMHMLIDFCKIFTIDCVGCSYIRGHEQKNIVIESFVSLLIRETLKKSNQTKLVSDKDICDLMSRDFLSLVFLLRYCDKNESHSAFNSKALLTDFYHSKGIRAAEFSNFVYDLPSYMKNYFENETKFCKDVFLDIELQLFDLSEYDDTATSTAQFGFFSAETTTTTTTATRRRETESDDQELPFKCVRFE